MWQYESIYVNYHDPSVVLTGTVASAQENREHSIRRNSLFPQQPSKHCKNSPPEPDKTIQTNGYVLIGGMCCTYKYPRLFGNVITKSILVGQKNERPWDTHTVFFLSLTKTLCQTRWSCVECWERKSFPSCISWWKKRERGGELSKLNACHTFFPLHDASHHHGSRVISRSGGRHPYIMEKTRKAGYIHISLVLLLTFCYSTSQTTQT